MLRQYYQQELNNLRSIGIDFARDNPAIAPMLGEPSADPDVERLLEGVAYLTATVRQRMDDEFPELIHNLLRQLWPHSLRPVPSAVLMQFSPDRVAGQVSKVPSGTYVESVPVEGLSCRFRTCGDTVIHPFGVSGVSYEAPAGSAPFIQTSFMFSAEGSRQLPDRLRLFLGGRYQDASALYLLLLNQVECIRVCSMNGEQLIKLPASALSAAGFEEEEALIPRPANGFDGYRLLQEYFLMPNRFTCVDLCGLDQAVPGTGDDGFVIEFVLKKAMEEKLHLTDGSFLLSVVPAINIFSHPAVPVAVDHTKTEYGVQPESEEPVWHQIYSIESVSGYVQGGGDRCCFEPFHSYMGAGSEYVYSERVRIAMDQKRMNFAVSIAYPSGSNVPDLSSLSFDVLCTNGFMPEWLGVGEIRVPVDAEQTACRNISKPTVAGLPSLGTETLWRLISLLTLNDLSLTTLENLKALLSLFLMDGYRDRRHEEANRKRIDGILDLEFEHIERLVGASLMRGVEVRLKVDRRNFAGAGDLFLFGSVLELFFGLYAAINSFSRLRIEEVESGEAFVWPERIGNQQLI